MTSSGALRASDGRLAIINQKIATTAPIALLEQGERE